MKLTNKAGLPSAIVEAVRNDGYSMGNADFSCTGLLAPPQQQVLMRKHRGEIVEDVSDSIYALIGQAIHTILERAEPSALVEKRLYMHIDGLIVSGQFDRLTISGKTLQDYKICSVWEYIHGMKPDRIAQLNILAEICWQNGYRDITVLEAVMIFRDWMKSKAKHDRDYPDTQVKRVPVELWPQEKRLAFIHERLRLHMEAEEGADIPCTPQDRWARPDSWAVMKKGRKSALRVLESKEAAAAWMAEKGGDEIIHRKGVSVRCEDYCPVSQYCAQYAAEKRG